MVVASLRDYLLPELQIPLFLLFAGVWLIGGPYLTRRALARHTDLPRSKRHLGRCAQLNLLTTGAGLITLIVVGGFFVVVAQRTGMAWVALGGLILGLPATLAMALAAGLNLLDQHGKAALRVTAATTGPLLVLLLMVVAGATVPAWFLRQDKLARDRCGARLKLLYDRLEKYADSGRHAPSLEALVQKKFIDPASLSCPSNPEVALGYHYVPPPAPPAEGSGGAQPREQSNTICICDKRGNHGGSRMVLFTDGRVVRLDEADFGEYLKMPGNEAMAKLVAAER